MSDIVLSAVTAMRARYDLRPGNASAKNGLVSVKLHRIRQELDVKLSASLQAFDEAQRRHAKCNDAGPIVEPGRVFLPPMTQVYETDPEKAADLAADLSPILDEQITLTASKFTAQEVGSIMSETDIGASLAHFTDAVT